MKGIYKFGWDLTYGILSGIFIADSEEIRLLENNKIVLNFGEALGKHSYIDDIEVVPGDFKKLTEDQDLVQGFIENDMFCGYSPFDVFISPSYMNISKELLDK